MDYSNIQYRAEILLEQIEDDINSGYDLSCPSTLDGYKASFCLAKRNLDLYVRSFKDSGLMFSITEAEAIWEKYVDHLEDTGYMGMSKAEKIVLQEAQEKIRSRFIS